jgi:hypothetical protein
MGRRIKVSQLPQRGRGRPRLGDYRIECVVPKAALDELKRRETATGIYRTRIAANILCGELIGGAAAPQIDPVRCRNCT